jgi:hypothetical protein
VDHWLGGARSPTLKNLDVVAEALGIEPWDLIRPEQPALSAIQPDTAQLRASIQAALPRASRSVLKTIRELLEDDLDDDDQQKQASEKQNRDR